MKEKEAYMRQFIHYTVAVLFVWLFSHANAQAHHQQIYKAAHLNIQHVRMVIDINKSDAKQLATLKGIGLKLGERIVAYRKAHGRFKQIEDLAVVSGISVHSVEKLIKNNPNRIKADPD